MKRNFNAKRQNTKPPATGFTVRDLGNASVLQIISQIDDSLHGWIQHHVLLLVLYSVKNSEPASSVC